jgi:inorganic pyrophosphatase
MMEDEFWRKLDQLLNAAELRVDRPQDSKHPRYPSLVYPLDYGYLEGTTSADGAGIDVWVGSLPDRRVTGILCTVDRQKRDAEIKLLVGCIPDEAQAALAVHQRDSQAAILIARNEKLA